MMGKTYLKNVPKIAYLWAKMSHLGATPLNGQTWSNFDILFSN